MHDLLTYADFCAVRNSGERVLPTENHGVPGSNPAPATYKVLQIVQKVRALAVLLRLAFRGVSTAGSRNGLF